MRVLLTSLTFSKCEFLGWSKKKQRPAGVPGALSSGCGGAGKGGTGAGATCPSPCCLGLAGTRTVAETGVQSPCISLARFGRP